MTSHRKPQTLVMKFGGTSVGTPEAMQQAAEIVQQAKTDWPHLVVVTSALAGVTNLLLESAARAAAGDRAFVAQAAEELHRRHKEIATALVATEERRACVQAECDALLSEFNLLCQAIAVLGEASPRALDAIASLGERMSVRLLAAVLESSGMAAQWVEATCLIRTDEAFQNAHPDMEITTRQCRQVLTPMLESGQVPVVTGFIGATARGAITTLGRGGSDYSAAIVGAAIEADDVWIWTDVNGVLTADPRLVSDARTLPYLTYREMGELAYFGAKVLHPKTILPLVERGIGLRICNTFNPQHPGTRLVKDSRNHGSGIIKAVTAIRKQRLITIEGRGMIGVPGVAARTFRAVASTGTSVPLISQASSEQSICFAVPEEASARVVQALQETFAHELAVRDIDRIWMTDEVAIVTVVGEGMIHTPGVAGQVFSVLGEKNINVIAIAQGSSEVSISLVVAAGEMEAAVRALHGLILRDMKHS